MADVHYEVVEHDGDWAYKVAGVFSETFATHEAAHQAAKSAADRQSLGGETTGILYEDSQGEWRGEVARGDDRPQADVVDEA